MRFHRSNIGKLQNLSTYALSIDNTDQVVVVTLVPVGGEVDAIFEQAEVNADVQLMLFLVGEFAVLDVIDIKSRFLNVGKGAVGLEAADDGLRVGHFRRAAVSGEGV